MTLADLQQLLDHVRSGQVAPEAAVEQVLQLVNARSFQDLGFARVDHQRELRQGFPEVVFGPGKTPEQIRAISAEIVGRGHTLLVTRTTEEAFAAVQQAVPGATFHPVARTITYRQTRRGAGPRNDSGRRGGNIRSPGCRGSVRHRRGDGQHGRSPV